MIKRTLAVLLGIMMILMIPLPAQAKYAEAYGYGGARWKNTTICVQNQIKNPMIRDAVYRAIVNIRDTTNLHVLNFGSSSCVNNGYTQIIYAREEYQSSVSWMGMATPNGHTWGSTPNMGYSTYFFNSGAKLRMNTYYLKQYPDAGTWRHLAIHELSHLMGLGHRDDTCYSVVTSVSLKTCNWTRPTVLQSVDKKLINTIYSW